MERSHNSRTASQLASSDRESSEAKIQDLAIPLIPLISAMPPIWPQHTAQKRESAGILEVRKERVAKYFDKPSDISINRPVSSGFSQV